MNWRRRISWLLQEFDFRTDRKRILFLLEALGITLLICQVFYSSLTAFIFLLPLTAAIYLQSKKREDEKRCQELVTEFKECMNSLLTALKAGYSCENAFRAAEEEMIVFYGKHSEIVCGLNRIVGGLDSNVPLEELLRGFASESRSEEIRDFAEIFAIARKSGGNMTDILQRTISQIQNRMDVEREIRVLMSSKKLEQTIMDVVPFGIIAYIGITSRGFFDVLYHNAAGVLIMTACLLAYLGAFVLSEKIAAIKV